MQKDGRLSLPNEVFGDIMVLALPLPPVDPDNVITLSSKDMQQISFKFYMSVDTPTLLLKLYQSTINVNQSFNCTIYILCMKCAKPSYALALAMHIKDINQTKQNY